MDSADAVASTHFRARELARRVVDYRRCRDAEHRQRERFGRPHRPFPWAAAAEAVLRDEVLEDGGLVVALVQELARQGCSEVALCGLDLVLARGAPPPSKAMFDAAIAVSAREFQDARCLEQYERMRAYGLAPDLASLNLALSGVCCTGNLPAAARLLGELPSLGLRPNSFTALMVLQACNYKRRGAYQEAIEVVRSLEASGQPANEEVVEALLQVCEAAMHRAASYEGAQAVFAALGALGLADNTRCYNALLRAAGKGGRWREAQALYGQMRADEVPATLDTYTALIQACVVGRALDHALEIFEYLVAGRAAHEAVPASIATYNHLIHACHQAGMLEKALEIAAWVARSGVEFDACTYEELMATIEVAQLWDDKALRGALSRAGAVLPKHLRPAPYDAMRVMYLDHLEALQEEEMLALEKLGNLGSWAPKSLTRGRLDEGASAPLSAQASAPGTVSGPQQPSGCGEDGRPQGQQLSSKELAALVRASASAVAGSRGVAAGGGGGGGGGTGVALAKERSGDLTSSTPLTISRAPSMRRLLTLQMSKRLPGLASGPASYRALGAASPTSSAPSPAGSAPNQPAAPTGFHEPPSWAQLQSMDAATAGPHGTLYRVGAAAAAATAGGPAGAGRSASSSGPPVPPIALPEPSNTFSPPALAQASPGHATSRAVSSRRAITVPSPGPGIGPGQLSPGAAPGLGLQLGTEGAAAVGVSPGRGGGFGASAAEQAGAVTARGRSSPSRRQLLAQQSAARDPRLAPSPLPAMASVQTVMASRRYSLAPLTQPPGAAQPAGAAAAGGDGL